MSKTTLLLIDDDPTLLELVADYLQKENYHVVTASDGASGLRLASEISPSLVMLDVMMPGMDGWKVCEQLRANFSFPIIMLTAKDQEFDKLRGFNLGVDDYVTKPFSFAELAARARAVLRRARSGGIVAHSLSSGNLTIDMDRRRVKVENKVIGLTPTEYRLLETLARFHPRPVPYEHLLSEVWGPEYDGEIDNVKHYVWSLRKKIEQDQGNPKHLLTERGFGYRLE